MRMESAARAKGNGMGTAQLRPREGTRTRAVYDLLYENKGIPLNVPLSMLGGKRSKNLINAIRDFYGLDVRCISIGKWVLAGEWFGKTYVDYIADHIAKTEKVRHQ